MGVHKHGGTMPGALTPICNGCGVALCWDISEEEYEAEQPFWDDWLCRECNGGEAMSLRAWLVRKIKEIEKCSANSK